MRDSPGARVRAPRLGGEPGIHYSRSLCSWIPGLAFGDPGMTLRTGRSGPAGLCPIGAFRFAGPSHIDSASPRIRRRSPMTDIVIASAVRTAIGAFNGGLASLPAHKLGEIAIAEVLRRAQVEPGEVSEVILGQILAAGEGMNPARQAAVAAGIPFEVTAYGVNQLCGSGLRTVALGYQAIRNGDSEIVVAGGQESMSQAPHCIHLRNGVKMGDAQMVDTMIKDGLWDAFNGYHMGNTAENVAQRWQITREQQDAFAVRSQE